MLSLLHVAFGFRNVASLSEIFHEVMRFQPEQEAPEKWKVLAVLVQSTFCFRKRRAQQCAVQIATYAVLFVSSRSSNRGS